MDELISESDIQYRALVESAKDYVFVVGRDGRVLYANEAAKEIFQPMTEEIVGRTPAELFPQDHVRFQSLRIWQVFQSGETMASESRVTLPKGKVWLDTWLTPHKDANGQVTAVIGISRDITARKEAEEALRTSQSEYRSTIDAMRDPLHVVDTELRVVLTNSSLQQWLEELGQPGLLVGQKLSEAFTFLPDQVWQEYQLVLDTGQLLITEETNTVGGHEIITEARKMPILEGGRVARIVTVIHDITARRAAEKELHIKENALASAINGIAIGEFGGNLTYVNPAFLRMWGYESESEVLGRPSTSFWQSEGPPSRAIEALIGGGSWVGEMVGKKKDGTLFDVQVAATMVRDHEGQPISMMASFLDITEHKLAIAALKESEERFRSIFDNVSVGAALIDGEGCVLVANEADCRFLGYSLSELTGMHFSQLTYPEDQPITAELFSMLMTGSVENYKIDKRYVRKDGQVVWGRLSASAIRGSDNQPEYVAALCEDITERKRAEEERRLSEERYRILIETSPDAIALSNLDASIIMVNQSAVELFGEKSAQDIIGRNTMEWMVPEDRPRAIANVQKTLETGAVRLEEYTMVRRDGSTFPCEMSASLLRDAQGQPQLFIGVCRDITERRRAEEALRASEARYRTLVETSPDAITLADLEGRILMLNQRAVQMYGLDSAEEVVGQSAIGWIVPADRPQAMANLVKASEMGMMRNQEYTMVRKDGSTFPGEVSATLVLDAQGQPQAFLGITRDITERKRAEGAIRESEARYRTLVEVSPDAISVSNLDGNLLMLNQQALRMYGIAQAEDVLGQPAANWLIPEDRPRATENLRKTLETGMIRDIPYTMVRQDGTTFPAELTASLIRDAQGRPQIFLGIVRDMTERRRAQEVLWLTKLVVEHSPVVLYRVRAEEGWPVEFISENVSQFGYSAEEIISGRIDGLQLVHPADQESYRHRIMDAAARGANFIQQQYRLVTRDGQTRWGDEYTVIVRGPDGQVTHYQGVVLDITERKQLEEQFLQSQKMEVIGRLAGGIAHDFNNLLTAIRGYAGLARDALPSGPVRSDVEQVLLSAERAAELTGKLLAFSRRQVIEPRVVNLNTLVTEMNKILGRLLGEDVELIVDTAANLGPVKVDPGQIEQVIVNLAVNARDAMPRGGTVRIKTANTVVDEETAHRYGISAGPYVTLQVSDNGTGMAKETRDHIFEPFFTTKEVGQGAGLGLAIVYGIVQQHQGHVQVESIVGRGTAFTIYLPRAAEPVERAAPVEQEPPLPRGSETILLVEDEAAVRSFMARVLKMLGYTVLEAGTGPEALRIAAEGPTKIDLLLSDVILPQMNGRALAGQLLQLHPGLPVLYVSGHAAGIIAQHGIVQEGISFLQKPFGAAALAQRVRQALDGGELA